MKMLWENYRGDFDALTDEQVEQLKKESQDAIDEHEKCLEAIASWERAGKPRDTP